LTVTKIFATAPRRAVGTLVLKHEIPARQPWSGIILRRQVFRIIDTCGQQAVDTLFYAAGDHAERYSAQDTLQTQGSAYISTGTQLVSNAGNVMLTVTGDSCGRHDTSAGACSCESNTVRFGHHTKFEHACRENFVLEVARHGMTKRDIVPNINFFMNVPIAPNGDLVIDDGISAPGSYVEMVAAMDVLCVISNCPQINNPCNGFNPTPVGVEIYEPAAS
jgi:urea carboxylase-associated protein 1